MQTKLTVAIPTFNRAALLKESLASVLAQDYEDFQVIVLDNASTDETGAVVQSFNDPRLTYIQHPSNIGIWANWNRALEINQSPYLSIFHDDDLMQPGFLRESMTALESHPRAGFSFCLCEYVDGTGKRLSVQGAAGWDEGCVSGLDFLERMISIGYVVHTVSILMRSSALKVIGPFDSPHSKATFDLNLYLRLAARFDLAFIRKPLIRLRVHAGQLSQSLKRNAGGHAPFSTLGECLDAVAYLLESPRAANLGYRSWLSQRLLALNARRSEYAHYLLSGINWTWEERLEMSRREIEKIIPEGQKLILIDGDQLATGGTLAGRQAFPFTERDGYFYGPPADDAAAIQELNRLRQAGAGYLIFAWPGFFFIDHYPKFYEEVRRQFHCLLCNPRIIVFDLSRQPYSAALATDLPPLI